MLISDSPFSRFYQLEALMKHHNSGFNVYRDFAYGCNCNLLATGGVGDRPLTQPGWGQAIDDRDVVCKAYKGFAFDFIKNNNK